MLEDCQFTCIFIIMCGTGKQEQAETVLETLKAVDHPLGKQVGVLVEICSYAGL